MATIAFWRSFDLFLCISFVVGSFSGLNLMCILNCLLCFDFMQDYRECTTFILHKCGIDTIKYQFSSTIYHVIW